MDRTGDLHQPDMIILPGTKSTIADLLWLRQNGLEAAIHKAAAAGTLIFGVCGGYQMLGRTIADPDGVEAAGMTEIAGLGLLDIETVFAPEKVQAQTRGCLPAISGALSGLSSMAYEGYEIHMGRSGQGLPPLIGKSTVYGTYVHGFFDAPGISDAILRALCDARGIDSAGLDSFDWQSYRQQQYDKLADAVRSGLDMELVYRILHREV